MGGMVAMAHVDAEGIDTGAEQPCHHFGRAAGRTDSGQYLDLAAAMHVLLIDLCHNAPFFLSGLSMACCRKNPRTMADELLRKYEFAAG